MWNIYDLETETLNKASPFTSTAKGIAPCAVARLVAVAGVLAVHVRGAVVVHAVHMVVTLTMVGRRLVLTVAVAVICLAVCTGPR